VTLEETLASPLLLTPATELAGIQNFIRTNQDKTTGPGAVEEEEVKDTEDIKDVDVVKPIAKITTIPKNIHSIKSSSLISISISIKNLNKNENYFVELCQWSTK